MTLPRDMERSFARCALFVGLSPAERRRLASLASIRTFPTGTMIIREGDTSMAVYVVLSGRVSVTIAGQVVRELGADDVFGELGVLDDAPRSASIVALEPTKCALLGTWDVRRNPRIALGLLPIMARWIRGTHAHSTLDDATWIDTVSQDTL
jgi:CRP/FNR family cyclic AMP-dependent transcriptional regulator